MRRPSSILYVVFKRKYLTCYEIIHVEKIYLLIALNEIFNFHRVKYADIKHFNLHFGGGI